MVARRANSSYALGIHLGHDAGAALVGPSGPLISLREEQARRIKHYNGFPISSIEYIRETFPEFAGLRVIAFSTSLPILNYEHKANIVDVEGNKINISIESADIERMNQELFMNIYKYFYGYEDRLHFNFRDYIENIVDRFDCAIYYIHHHRAHAACSRITPKTFDYCIVVDGKGNRCSSSVFSVANHDIKLLSCIDEKSSLGAMYQCATELLGYIGMDNEYKLMGLSAYGVLDNDCYNFIMNNYYIFKGNIRSSHEWAWIPYSDLDKQADIENPLQAIVPPLWLEEKYRKIGPKNFAATIQKSFEDLLIKYVLSINIPINSTIFCSGGCFLNAKANGVLRKRFPYYRFFFYPDAGDSGLAVCAASEALFHEGYTISDGLFSVYNGRYSSDMNCEIESLGVDVTSLVEKLVNNKVIGTYIGRAEIGPRSLGNRSILAIPSSLEMKNKINNLKGRESFIPLAPSVIAEDARRFFDVDGDEYYMNMTVTTTAFGRSACPAVVHHDGSARPQLVTSEGNLFLHQLLSIMQTKGIPPVVINTSFNSHGHPTLDSPGEAIEYLRYGLVDVVWTKDGWFEI